MLFKNYYRILGISRNASFDEIKRAYRKKAMENHTKVLVEKHKM